MMAMNSILNSYLTIAPPSTPYRKQSSRWGKLTLVYRPEDADVILVVESRPSEDVLAVYDAHMPQTYLWRVMGRSGLQKDETPLLSEFEKAWKQMTN